MGWFSSTPKWYDKVMKTVSVLPNAYILDSNSMIRLEDIRKSNNIDHDNFAFAYMGCKTVVKKLNLLIYNKIKTDSPHGTPEKKLMKQLIVSDLASFRQNVSEEEYLLIENRTLTPTAP
jgi:hypothetical protein